MTDPSFILNPDSHITIAFPNGSNFTIYTSNEIFADLIAAVKAKQWITAYDLIVKPVASIQKAFVEMPSNDGSVKLEHGVVYVDGEAVDNVITDRIVRMSEEGFDIEPMKQFLGRLMKNPSFRAVKELYGFLEATGLPITADGHFLAYKKVRADFTDCHTGKFDNSVGKTVSMPRNRVNDDKNETCSSGLHFCGRSYLGSFSGARTVAVKIDPADVVSIPTDYNNAKGRACKYVVVQELDIDTETRAPVAKLEEKSVRQPVATTTVKQGVASFTVDTNQEVKRYDSLEDAAISTGIRKEYIERVLTGGRNSTGGYHWRYVPIEVVEQYDVDDRHEDICPTCENTLAGCVCCAECGLYDTHEPFCSLDDDFDDSEYDLDDEDDIQPPSTLDGMAGRSSDFT